MQRLLMIQRAGRPEHTPESEPMLVEGHGRTLVLRLDDGERLEVDATELIAAAEDVTREAA